MKRFRESTSVFAVALFVLLVLPRHAPAEPPSAGQAPGPAKMEAKSGCPGECGCPGCGCPGCGQECGCPRMHHPHGMPMMEGMKKHMEEVRKRVAALRDHEKKLEGITDPTEFRKAAVEHFRMLDDLHESHVRHMESMAGGMGHGHPHH
jgi:hypothetical protein